MRIAITGASGLLGRHLVRFLEERGDTVFRMVRSPSDAPNTIYWNYLSGHIEHKKLEGLDGLIHLAGENILQWPWTKKTKTRILESRSLGTAFLAQSLRRLDRPPPVFLSASGISYYGSQGDRWMDENSPMDPNSFLASVVHAWENAVQSVSLPHTRTAFLRIGIVLGDESRIIKQVTPLFALGLGARLWPANPYISWIDLADTIRAIHFVLTNASMTGAVNIVAPNPVTQHQLAQSLAQSLKRPLWLYAPSAIIPYTLGQMGTETILSSIRVRPSRLLDEGFGFQKPRLAFGVRRR